MQQRREEPLRSLAWSIDAKEAPDANQQPARWAMRQGMADCGVLAGSVGGARMAWHILVEDPTGSVLGHRAGHHQGCLRRSSRHEILCHHDIVDRCSLVIALTRPGPNRRQVINDRWTVTGHGGRQGFSIGEIDAVTRPFDDFVATGAQTISEASADESSAAGDCNDATGSRREIHGQRPIAR